ncbi:hypothetical protein BPNPMPFG_006305 [Mesorhizobium sp. AR07]|uniref:hypothetical protein n=1 Tax=Mesorhizobium sp. AR07 TaxID=2865838 RepID=UPI00215EF3E1|nr:hypothetical protein [Mesorhizobium sp. AR07]UVK44390.1 hypothetical protein BPNPMPFG_006305 [Mesorhizobium sp. AR07]
MIEREGEGLKATARALLALAEGTDAASHSAAVGLMIAVAALSAKKATALITAQTVRIVPCRPTSLPS